MITPQKIQPSESHAEKLDNKNIYIESRHNIYNKNLPKICKISL